MKPEHPHVLAEERIDAELKRRLDPAPEAVQRMVRRSLGHRPQASAKTPWRRQLAMATGVLLVAVFAVALLWPVKTTVKPADGLLLSNSGGDLVLSRNRGSKHVLLVPRTASVEPAAITIRNSGSVISVASSAEGPRLLLSKGES